LKKIIYSILIFLILSVIVTCGRQKTSLSLGTLTVNGPGINGSIPVGTKRIYTLKGIETGNHYTVSSWIRSFTTPTAPDGSLRIDIYTSEDAFKNNPAVFAATSVSSSQDPTFSEATFTAVSSGDYVAAMSGTPPHDVPDEQFFYKLRVTSAEIKTAFTPTITTNTASNTATISSGYRHVYHGGDVLTTGTYTINLRSNVTTTAVFPVLYVYSNLNLKRDDLLYSCNSDTLGQYLYVIKLPSLTATPDPLQNNIVSGVTIPNVPFTSSTDTSGTPGPYIVVNGIASSTTYSLSISPN